MWSTLYPTGMYELNEAQINHFHQNGWLGPLDTFSIEEVETVRKGLEEISKIERFGGQKIRTFDNTYLGTNTSINLHFEIDAFSRLWQDKRIVTRLNQLGEESLLLWRTTVWNRMPGQAGVGWHQGFDNYSYGAFEQADAELVFPEDEDALDINVWMALVDIKPETGVLAFANGTHREPTFAVSSTQPGQNAYQQGYKFTQAAPDKEPIAPEREIDETRWDVTEIPSIKAGQIIIFTERVMHRSPANRSDMERWACNGRYIRPSVQVHPQRFIDGYEYGFGWDLSKHFNILVSGEDRYGVNKIVPRYTLA